MDGPDTLRPPRPLRSVPAVPDFPQLNTTDLLSSPELDDAPFATPLASPLAESPIQDAPPDDESLSAAAAIPLPATPTFNTELTPTRAHYLKKELIHLEFRRELDALVTAPTNNISTFSYLGKPFTHHRKMRPISTSPFLASLLSRNLSPTSVLDDNPEDSEEAARHRMLIRVERNLAMLLTSATKLIEGEEVVRLTQADLNRLEALAKKRLARERKLKDSFDEFIIRTRRRAQPDVFVSRRYGDFRTLADELHKHYPDEVIPQPPAKDRSFVNVTVSSIPSTPAYPTGYPSPPPTASTASHLPPPSPLSQSRFRPPPPGSPHAPQLGRSNTKGTVRQRMVGDFYDTDHNSSSDSFSVGSPTSPFFGNGTNGTNGGMAQQAARLSREKNRLTLRSYLHTLLSSSTFSSSPVLKSFLLSGPTRLSEEELADAKRREEADRMREDGRMRFAKEITARVDSLRDTVRGVKGELMGRDGLTHIFATIKENPDVRNLPPSYQAVLEWARISNPMAMIRGVLDLFLAQPFGGRSLLQRMFTGSLMEEVRALQEDIEAVKEKVEDPVMCEKVRLYVYAPREIQAVYKPMQLLRTCMLSPLFCERETIRHSRGHNFNASYSDDDEGPQDEEAWLFEDLSLLAKLYARLKDREQLIELIFEGTTADLLKDIITIFYAPLAQVYRAASIADSLGDMQNFMNDLIRTVEQSEEYRPAKTVQTFIDLIQRHEQSFYSFVHKVHSKGEGLFTNLMRWIELFLNLMRDGIGDRISLEFLLPHAGNERETVLKEVDEIALYHYKLKVAYEAKLRRRFGRTQGMNDADAEDEATAQLVNGVVRDLSFGDVVEGDAEDLAAQDADDDDDDSSDEYETSSGSGTRVWIGADSDSGDDDDSDGGETERDATPHPEHRPSAPHTRSNTIGHSPVSPKPSRSPHNLPDIASHTATHPRHRA
ncbi:uncharacterized protein BXZ73DRAFT_97466 [Epithele typhae]|uniref:uncharacterized protein n=1 Tax=Epithele typhae TaxID=378194 RepID=UPI002007A6D2|nr:uncharacterized protein BXZ73DRAFT_97466 [Epithele typhae]KAH9943424.1 hypothetical protein BXZ73DRAFT_97466 [Epithele typhae]